MSAMKQFSCQDCGFGYNDFPTFVHHKKTDCTPKRKQRGGKRKKRKTAKKKMLDSESSDEDWSSSRKLRKKKKVSHSFEENLSEIEKSHIEVIDVQEIFNDKISDSTKIHDNDENQPDIEVILDDFNTNINNDNILIRKNDDTTVNILDEAIDSRDAKKNRNKKCKAKNEVNIIQRNDCPTRNETIEVLVLEDLSDDKKIKHINKSKKDSESDKCAQRKNSSLKSKKRTKSEFCCEDCGYEYKDYPGFIQHKKTGCAEHATEISSTEQFNQDIEFIDCSDFVKQEEIDECKDDVAQSLDNAIEIQQFMSEPDNSEQFENWKDKINFDQQGSTFMHLKEIECERGKNLDEETDEISFNNDTSQIINDPFSEPNITLPFVAEIVSCSQHSESYKEDTDIAYCEVHEEDIKPDLDLITFKQNEFFQDDKFTSDSNYDESLTKRELNGYSNFVTSKNLEGDDMSSLLDDDKEITIEQIKIEADEVATVFDQDQSNIENDSVDKIDDEEESEEGTFTCNECGFRYSNYIQFTNHKKNDCQKTDNVEFVSSENNFDSKQEIIELNEDSIDAAKSGGVSVSKDNLNPILCWENGDREENFNVDVMVATDPNILSQTENFHEIVELIDETHEEEDSITNKQKHVRNKEGSIYKRGKVKVKSLKTYAAPEPRFSCKDCGFKYSDFNGFILHKKEDCY